MSRRIVLVDIGGGLTLSGVLPSVALHDSYSARAIARNGTPPYAFDVIDGALPDGVTLDRASGIFSAGDVALAGSFPFTLQVTDVTGAKASRQFLISVVAEPVPIPQLTLSGDFVDATIGTPYSSDLDIAGGNGIYSNPRTIVGAVPAGLSLSIVGNKLRLSGTPTGGVPSEAGTVAFRLAVDSGDGQTATSVQSVDVTSASVDPIALSIYNKMMPLGLASGAYWDMTETAGSTRQDSLGGFSLLQDGSVGTTQGPRGLGDVSVNLSNSGQILSPQNSDLGTNIDIPAGAVHEIFGWFLITQTGGNQFIVARWDATSPDTLCYGISILGGVMYGQEGGSGYHNAAAPLPAAGAWHFCSQWHDPEDNLVRLQTDDGAIYTSPAASDPNPQGVILTFGSASGNFFMAGGLSRWGYLKGSILESPERTWLINSGLGRNWAEIAALAGH